MMPASLIRSLFLCCLMAGCLLVYSLAANAGEPDGHRVYFSIGLASLSPEGVRFTDIDSGDSAKLYGRADLFDDGDLDTGLQLHLAAGTWLTSSLRGQVEFALAGNLDYRGNTNYDKSGERQPSRAELGTRQLLFAGFYDFSPWKPGRGPRLQPYVGAGVGFTDYCLKAYVQTFPYGTTTSLRRGPNGEIPLTRLPSGSGRQFTWMLAGGVVIPITERTKLDLSYRYTDAGEIGTDVGDITIVRYRSDGSRREIPVRINETTADFKTHALLATIRFEF